MTNRNYILILSQSRLSCLWTLGRCWRHKSARTGERNREAAHMKELNEEGGKTASQPDFVDGMLVDLERELPRLDTKALQSGERILRLAKSIFRRLDVALGDVGIRTAGFGCLAALRRAGKPYELKPSQLSRQTLLTSGAITSRIDQLERAWLVERTGPSGNDRRTVMVRLTPAGRKLVDTAYAVYCAELNRMLEPMTQQDIAGLERGLRSACLALGDVEDGAPA